MDRVESHNQYIENHFNPLAANYPNLKKRNRYYNNTLRDWVRSALPTGKKVIDLGCGRGDVLASVGASEGLGIDVSANFIDAATADNRSNPELHF